MAMRKGNNPEHRNPLFAKDKMGEPLFDTLKVPFLDRLKRELHQNAMDKFVNASADEVAFNYDGSEPSDSGPIFLQRYSERRAQLRPMSTIVE